MRNTNCTHDSPCPTCRAFIDSPGGEAARRKKASK